MSSFMISYQKLQKLPGGDDEDDELVVVRRSIIGGGGGGRWGRRRWRWRRPRVRLAGKIRRVVRRKAVVVRLAVKKVMRRLKEARPYMGELFAGNYLFMQVNPSATMPYLDKSMLLASRVNQNLQQNNYVITSKAASQ